MICCSIDHACAPASPNRRASSISRAAARASAASLRDDDALARREPVGLDDDVAAELVDRGVGLGDVAHDRERARSGCRGGAKNCLLNALLPSSRAPSAPGPNVSDAARAQLVGEPGDERRLGPDDDQIDPLGDREVAPGRRDRSGRPARSARAARCPGCRARATTAWPACAQPPGERVLATAAADDEDLHRKSLVPEVAHAGEQHREAVLVGRGDDLLVAHRAARLDDRDRARLGEHVDAVAEREERVGRDRPRP